MNSEDLFELGDEKRADTVAMDGLLREVARSGDGDDEKFVARVLEASRKPQAAREVARPRFRFLRAAAAAAVFVVVLWSVRPEAPAPLLTVLSGNFVPEGNRITTSEGQDVMLRLSDRSTVKVEENTDLIVRSDALTVELKEGTATFDVTKKSAGKAFEVATTYGDIRVHGTKFQASVDTEMANGALAVVVAEGAVEVRNELGKVFLWAGDTAVVRQDQAPRKNERFYMDPINLAVPHIGIDKDVTYDYDIVYVRAPRRGDDQRVNWTEIARPTIAEANADLMLLRPDGTEEMLVAGGEDGAITDPFVSFDGEWVFYSHIQGIKGSGQHGPFPRGGADIFKMHVKTRKIIRLTTQEFTPNTGAAEWSKDCKTPEKGKTNVTYGVFNLGPCPLPGGRLIFVSNRNAFKPPKHPSPTLQLFVMNDDGSNVEEIGYLNIGMALHPVILKDGRVMFSSLESQGLRTSILWGLWTINPDGTNWGPMISAFLPGDGAPNAFHFQTQLSDGSVIAEEYYNQNNSGFGTYLKLQAEAPPGVPGFGPAFMRDLRTPPLRFGRHDNGRPKEHRIPFSPYGIESFTRFVHPDDGPADFSVRGNKSSPRVGKYTHPSGAPDNHLLTVYSPGPANHQYKYPPEVDGGLYLIKSGIAIDEPAQMRLIKNDPNYNEQWPRALVPYKRIYGVDEPRRLEPLANDGRISSHLPEGTPFGLVGSSSLYKRESFPNGAVPPGSVTSTWAGGRDSTGYQGIDPFNTTENGVAMNWINQGADAGRYSNSDIHAIRILAMEPTTDRERGNYPRDGRLFFSHANERLRILGEIPVRKFKDGVQPVDPDGNPDTSFMAKIPADVAFTFQTLDKDGMVLNMAQTWHQVRPGEKRVNCGGCHSHSQKPTIFEDTAAAKPDYKIFDLSEGAPLLTSKTSDESKTKWDEKDQSGLRVHKGIKNVEYNRDIKPILQRSCVPCHAKAAEKPAGNLVLDGDDEKINAEHKGSFPGTYFRLAMDTKGQFGHKAALIHSDYRLTNASRYIRKFQSRRSLLIWKIYGERRDGFSNDDHPTETVPGDGTTLHFKGQPMEPTRENRSRADLDFTGSIMPPPEAVAGSYAGPDGKRIKVEPLTDEDRRTFVRWIDLGCPIDRDYVPEQPERRGYGWMCDDNRPTLTLTHPKAGANPPITRILVGMHDYYTGLEGGSSSVVADFAIDGVAPGENLAPKFTQIGQGIFEYKLSQPITTLARGRLSVSVRDRQGNTSRIERTFSVR